jgi:superfamily II DNA or RNA helicase
MPTILSNHGYKIIKKEYSTSEIKNIKDELTVKPFSFSKINMNDQRFSVFLESPRKLYLPRFYGIQRFGIPTENNILPGDPISVTFQGGLREEQKPIEDIYLKNAQENGGGIISLRCGGGKTVLALHIISVLKVKTIVIVHKDFLMTQWRDRIQQFIPDARIGKIQQNTIDTDNKDIVLAMVQSLSMKEYDEDTFDSFGLVVFDECHHLGAEVFHKSMAKVASKYSLGLSATPKRKDGLTRVFEWFIGPVVFAQTTKNEDYAEVQLIPFESEDSQYNKVELNFRKEPCMPRMINNICNHVPRTEMIFELIQKHNSEGRTILILSDRREHLNQLYKLLSDYSRGFYVGGMKPNELRDSQTKDILLATYSMASEGMDIPSLNTVILSSPKSDVEQSVGRIFRKKACDRTFHPLIIDIQDCFSMFEKQCQKRITFYRKMNFTLFKDGVELPRKKRGRQKTEPIVEFLLTDD